MDFPGKIYHNGFNTHKNIYYVGSHIKELIAQGEHQQLDYKFEVSDSRKLARTLVAFSNTDGGKLLIGVKDNGHIAGIRSEEEYYMIEAAANMYSKPPVKFKATTWNEQDKTILEIHVPKGDETYYALDDNDLWKAYIRVADQNFLANKVLLKVWEKKRKQSKTLVKYTNDEKILLYYLKQHQTITFSKFCRLAKINKYRAERILVNFIYLNIIEIHFTGTQTFYKLVKK